MFHLWKKIVFVFGVVLFTPLVSAGSAGAQSNCTNVVCEDFAEYNTSSSTVTMPTYFQSTQGFEFGSSDPQVLWYYSVAIGLTYLIDFNTSYEWTLPFQSVDVQLRVLNPGTNEQEVILRDANNNSYTFLIEESYRQNPAGDVTFYTWTPKMCPAAPFVTIDFPQNTAGNEVYIDEVCAFSCEPVEVISDPDR